MKRHLAISAAASLLALGQPASAALYQKQLPLNCFPNGNCVAFGTAVPAGKTLTINTASCLVTFNGAPSFGIGRLGATKGSTATQYFGVNMLSQNMAAATVQDAPATIEAGAAPVIGVQMNTTNVVSALCSVRGNLTP